MNRVLKTSIERFFRAVGHYPATLNGLSFRCDPHHVGWWRRASRNQWEPQTFRALERLLKQDSVFLDIGAWIGPTTLYAAKLCNRVFCFEPDQVAYEYLLWNIRLNALSNVVPFNLALAERDGLQGMSSFGGRMGDSMASLLNPTIGDGSTTVMGISWQTWLEICQPPPITLIKIDIEGGEFSLLPTMRNYLAESKPIIHLSTHAPYLQDDQRLANMEGLTDVLSVYGHCLDEKLQPVSFDELTSAETITSFRSFTFVE